MRGKVRGRYILGVKGLRPERVTTSRFRNLDGYRGWRSHSRFQEMAQGPETRDFGVYAWKFPVLGLEAVGTVSLLTTSNNG